MNKAKLQDKLCRLYSEFVEIAPTGTQEEMEAKKQEIKLQQEQLKEVI